MADVLFTFGKNCRGRRLLRGLLGGTRYESNTLAFLLHSLKILAVEYLPPPLSLFLSLFTLIPSYPSYFAVVLVILE